MPIWDYTHNLGETVIGGFVYRGTEIPDLVGAYVFADFGSGRIWSLKPIATGEFSRELLRETGEYISGFVQDTDGEMFVLSWSSGKIFKLTPGTSDAMEDARGMVASEGAFKINPRWTFGYVTGRSDPLVWAFTSGDPPSPWAWCSPQSSSR